MSKFSPVIIFVYARPNHTERTINALKDNYLSNQTDVIIYADAARSETDKNDVLLVRNFLRSVTGFKSISLIERDENYGLARNIIEGVSEVISTYGRAIILEDDIVTSPHFLSYMNDALVMYKDTPKVGSISGCIYPVNLSNLETSTFFLRIPLCWGWATWNDRWSYFEKKLENVNKTSKMDIQYINFSGQHDYFKQAKMNVQGKLNTWFIFWYMAFAKKKLLTLFPKHSLVDNIGHDGSGDNCGSNQSFTVTLSRDAVLLERLDMIESELAYTEHVKFFKSIKVGIMEKVKHKIIRFIIKK